MFAQNASIYLMSCKVKAVNIKIYAVIAVKSQHIFQDIEHFPLTPAVAANRTGLQRCISIARARTEKAYEASYRYKKSCDPQKLVGAASNWSECTGITTGKSQNRMFLCAVGRLGRDGDGDGIPSDVHMYTPHAVYTAQSIGKGEGIHGPKSVAKAMAYCDSTLQEYDHTGTKISKDSSLKDTKIGKGSALICVTDGKRSREKCPETRSGMYLTWQILET
ncbi:hypothetical protein F5877DRAFT_65073 [Lentinula edodes]|nr:hypothetical protein F5877DRAFT_65073 [Lentinula edodes]